ncbi:MAG: hypothetical protein WC891_05390 [Actinomycetota bacterium]
MVDVELRIPFHPPTPTVALVDSGADKSLFNLEILLDLGVSIAPMPKVQCGGVGGVVQGVEYPVEAYICGHKVKLKTIWTPAGKGKQFNLLGRDDFFKFFKVTFYHPKRQMDISPHNKK